MGKTPREQLLLMLLPALAVVGGYMLAFNRSKELEASQTALEAMRPTAVSKFDVEDEKKKLVAARAKQEQLKKEKTALDARWLALGAGRDSNPGARVTAVHHLSKMLWDRGLRTIEEAPATSENTGELPPSFQDALTKLKGDQQSSIVQRLWQIKFHGRYDDVLETLESLRDSGSTAIPVGLSMSEASTETAWRSWTLLLWL